MRIGFVTFHCSYNFGSALQAYAMQTILQKLGHSALIIDYRSPNFEEYSIISLKHPRATMQNFSSLKGLKAKCRRKKSFENFWRRYFNLTDETYTSKNADNLALLQDSFDCFVCGSDQIWNLDVMRGVDEVFFLGFAGDRRRVAYAPSLAHTSFKPEHFDKAKVAELLSKFDYLSVREEETVPLFQPLVDKEIKVVLDPTLLLDSGAYEPFLEEPLYAKDYIFVYLLRESPELVESAIQIAEATGKRVLYVCEKNLPIPNSTNLMGIGPDRFVSLIAHADFVLTNSFHATVFSLIYHAPFRVYDTDKSGARMRDLLGKLGVPELCVDATDSSPVERPNWAAVDSRLADLREDSLTYLREALA